MGELGERRVLYLGNVECLAALHNEIMHRRHYNILGYFSANASGALSGLCRYLGSEAEVLDFVKMNRVDRIYSSLGVDRNVSMAVVSYCGAHFVRFHYVPDLRRYLHRKVTLEFFGSVPLLSIYSEPLSKPFNRVVKRSFDVVVSLTFLLTLFPIIYLVVGVGVLCSSPGGVIFKQRRHGLNGTEFWCYKFRTMRLNDCSDTLQATKEDCRKTRFGDFLRRTSIDELPQFINVLKGDMSIVGPRPHMLRHTEEYSKLISKYMVRHFIRPGITGWAQVTGYRGETRHLSDMYGRVNADIWYMEHWSFWLDLNILFLTVVNVIFKRDKAAY